MENKKPGIRRGRGEKSVPEDLIPEIISRVPAKDLVRFTSVSKSWCSLICTDSYFVRLQIERTASLDPFLFIQKATVSVSGTWSFCNYWIDLNSAIQDQSINLQEIHNPFEDDADSPRRDTSVDGFCQGLVIQNHCPSLKMAVSNPTTKKHVVVPPNPAGDANVVFCGLGYDRAHDCYKLVTKVKHKDRALELMLYDVNKGGKWRSLQFGTWWKSQYEDLDDTDDYYHDLEDYSVKCVDGGVYWCIDMEETGPREMRMMVCFLLAEEEFHVVETPDFGEVMYYPNMTDLDERLGLVIEGLDRKHEIWSMQPGHVDGRRQWRWTKLFVIMDPYAMLPNHLNNRPLIPLCYSPCRNKVLIRVGQGQLFWYDVGKDEFITLNDPIYSGCFNARTCFRSLVGVGIS